MSRVELYRESHTVYEGDDWLGESFSIDAPGKWRWRFVKNGRVMADSGQGYSRRIDALNGCAIVLGGESAGDHIWRFDRIRDGRDHEYGRSGAREA